MKTEEKRFIVNIAWKPLFAATMTGILAKATSINAIVIGLALGAAAAIACYCDLKKYLAKK